MGRSGYGFAGSSLWLVMCFSKSVRTSGWLLRVHNHAILSAHLPVRPFAGLNLSVCVCVGGEGVKGSYYWVCQKLVVVSAHEASCVRRDVEFDLVQVVLSTYADVSV